MLNERFTGQAPVARAHGAAVFAGPVMGIAACLAHPEFSRVAEWLKPSQTGWSRQARTGQKQTLALEQAFFHSYPMSVYMPEHYLPANRLLPKPALPSSGQWLQTATTFSGDYPCLGFTGSSVLQRSLLCVNARLVGTIKALFDCLR